MNFNSITSEGDFADRLQNLVPKAYDNGVDVTGSWVVSDEAPNESEWEVQIVELARD